MATKPNPCYPPPLPFQVTLRELKAGKEGQARIPFTQRKKQFSTKYLPVSAPFHSALLSSVPAMMEEVTCTRFRF